MALGRILHCGTCGGDVPSILLSEALCLGLLMTAGSREEQLEETSSQPWEQRYGECLQI